jgi:NCAIR mutase (PurE)-related protein
MENPLLDSILERWKSGDVSPADALAEAARVSSGISELGYARLDTDRQNRCGFPEFVFGQGKTSDHLIGIVRELRKQEQSVLVTRLDPEAGSLLAKTFPGSIYHPLPRALVISEREPDRGRVVIITAGTTDLPVALEARLTAEVCGCRCDLISDSGVAGFHRLLSIHDRLRDADVILVVAGMEGALPSFVGGLVPCPVIAVPTSIGYGAALQGFTPLFGMLSSCANGILVVNIDNGFGAGCAAARIVNRIHAVSTAGSNPA